MHNLVHYNQLEWKHFEETVDKCNDELDLINDYFNCLIDVTKINKLVNGYAGICGFCSKILSEH